MTSPPIDLWPASPVVASRLTEAQVAAFHTDGYLLLRGVVDEVQVAEALRVINMSIARFFDPSQLQAYYARSFCPEIVANPVLFNLLRRSPLLEHAASLLPAGRVHRIKKCQIALRFPDDDLAAPDPPHLDRYWPPDLQDDFPHISLLAGVFLSCCRGPDEGNLRVWPGSHTQLGSWYELNLRDITSPGFPDLELGPPLDLEVDAGDCVLAHPLLAHAGAPNAGSHIRYAIYFRLCQQGQWHVRPEHFTSCLAEFRSPTAHG